MAWIESHQELARHPKTFKAARLLGISRITMIGHLHLLWWWALDYAEDGDLSRYDEAEIAQGAEWDGDAHAFVSGLVQAGFLDSDGDTMLFHDWHDYAGRLIEQRAANAERMKRKRAEHVRCTCSARTPATVPNRTKPNLTIPEEHVPKPQAVSTPAEKPPPVEFDQDSEPYQLACHLRRRILDNDDRARVPKATPQAMAKWAAEMDRLIRLDGREPAEIRTVIDWCQNDLFWRANILSPPALRKHFGRLNLAMKLPQNGAARTAKQEATRGEPDPDWDAFVGRTGSYQKPAASGASPN
jgi:hypothetical protein